MRGDRGLGLDELMIINPGEGRSAVFLGEDGVLYRIRRLAEASPASDHHAEGAPQALLGDDGIVYRVRKPRSGTSS
jgi:hypothetical protein